MNLGNIIKVDDEETFFSDCRQLLEQGERLLIYPEMGRRPAGLGKFKTWGAGVYNENKVTVLPCYIFGTTQNQEKPVVITIGKPITPEGSNEKITHDFEAAIRELRVL